MFCAKIPRLIFLQRKTDGLKDTTDYIDPYVTRMDRYMHTPKIKNNLQRPSASQIRHTVARWSYAQNLTSKVTP